MSWFDTKGLASLAKNALKQIDKVLDIQEEEDDGVTTTSIADKGGDMSSRVIGEKKLPGGANRECKTEPNTPSVEQITVRTLQRDEAMSSSPVRTSSFPSSTWGSFTGSFFENPNSNAMVIDSAPIMSTSTISTAASMGPKRQSMASNSDSIELLSPTSVCSELTSPSERVTNNSESIELLTATSTSEMTSPDSGPSLPGSIVIINDEAADEEDDSLSYNTVMDDTLTADNGLVLSMQQQGTCDVLGRSNTSTGTIKAHMSMEESQTVDSDSTQSFEDVQMQAISADESIKEQKMSHTGLDKAQLQKRASQSSSSPHNSNDEMETATSSDIEIISSPNGDSSSTNSTTTRTSPMKQAVKQAGSNLTSAINSKKGHYREPSEISILSEDSQSEVEKLMQRISELNEMLEAREVRLLQCERQNAVLQDSNKELQTALDAMKCINENTESAEDYTQRLSALEKKFQASIRERETLRIQIKTLKDELVNKIPKDNLTQVVAENNAMIAELHLEGEKLSKEILQQSNIIKKLRAKEKTSDAMLKKNKEQIVTMTDEIERLKKTLNAKEDVERSQIEAVHKMSSENRNLYEENAQQRSKIEDLQSKLTALQSSFDAVKAELQQRAKIHSDLTRTAGEALAAKKEKEQTEAENEEILQQLNEVREKLREERIQMAKREQQLRDENKQLLARLEAAEVRAETSTQEMSLTTIPLIRQLESLQNSLSHHTSHWNKEEKMLLEKLDLSQSRLKYLENVEATFKEKNDLLQARCLELEEKLSYALLQEEKTKMMLHQAQLDHSLKETNFNSQISTLNETVNACKEQIKLLEETNNALSNSTHSRSDVKPQTKLNEYDIPPQQLSVQTETDIVPLTEIRHCQSSPTASFDKNSAEETIAGSVDWQTDDLDCISNSGYNSGALINLNYVGHNTTTLEYLQSLLKQRDGELTHLQWELSRFQTERSILNEEISNLTLELENAKDKLDTYEALEKSFNDLQHRYDALLQMYGEKVERTEELELDLVELKEAYKIQIDELLARSNNA